MSNLEVHSYDNKLNEEISIYQNLLTYAKNISTNQKNELFLKFEEYLSDDLAKKYYIILIDQNDNSNFDLINKLNSNDLLFLIIEYLEKQNFKDNSLIDILTIQLQDMATGFCSQGRSIRLFQIVKSLYEN